MFGIDGRFSPEWAAWANGVAVRELDYHDTFLAAEYSHPGDNIPPILAVAQHVGADGAALVRGIATGYEIQVDLVKAISLHAHKIDHVAHLGPSRRGRHRHAARTAGRDDLPGDRAGAAHDDGDPAVAQGRDLDLEGVTPRPSPARWRSRRSTARCAGRPAPSPIWEGEDGVIAWLLDGPEGRYEVPLPEAGEAKRAILDTYTKEHSAEYQAQAWIDLARTLGAERPRAARPRAHRIASCCATSHHTHYVIGSGANDPQKYDPTASRETLDHSIPYIFTVALQDGAWDHDASLRARARAPGPTPSSCGTRSPPSRTRSGPAATTRTTRPRRRSAVASRSR